MGSAGLEVEAACLGGISGCSWSAPAAEGALGPARLGSTVPCEGRTCGSWLMGGRASLSTQAPLPVKRVLCRLEDQATSHSRWQCLDCLYLDGGIWRGLGFLGESDVSGACTASIGTRARCPWPEEIQRCFGAAPRPPNLNVPHVRKRWCVSLILIKPFILRSL